MLNVVNLFTVVSPTRMVHSEIEQPLLCALRDTAQQPLSPPPCMPFVLLRAERGQQTPAEVLKQI